MEIPLLVVKMTRHFTEKRSRRRAASLRRPKPLRIESLELKLPMDRSLAVSCRTVGSLETSACGGQVEAAIVTELSAPEVTTSGDSVSVLVSPSDPLVTLNLGIAEHVLDISGTTYNWDATQVTTFHIETTGTESEVQVFGTSLPDTASVFDRVGSFSSAAYTVDTEAFRVNTFDGNSGYDYGQMFGSTDSDEIFLHPNDSVMTTPTDIVQLLNFDRTDAYGLSGGSDYAHLFGSDGDDTFTTFEGYEVFLGQSLFYRTSGFERVDVFGKLGEDEAVLADTPNDDSFVGGADVAYMVTDVLVWTRGFELVESTSLAGSDTAILIDFASVDRLFGHSTEASAARQDRRQNVNGYRTIVARAADGESPEYELILDLEFETILEGDWINASLE